LNFTDFSARAHQVYDGIPEEFREGLDGLEVSRKTVQHPTLPEVYTLGECLSEFYPSEFGGAGEVLSRVVLYYGSFLALSRSAEDWDWEGEIFETVTHEVRHHLEHLASEIALEEMDYAEDQNFRRREGERFDPFFFRAGGRVASGVFEVDGDLFVEAGAEPRERSAIRVEVRGVTFAVRVPGRAEDIHYLRIRNPTIEVTGDLYVVLVKRRGIADWLRRVFRAGELTVGADDVDAEQG